MMLLWANVHLEKNIWQMLRWADKANPSQSYPFEHRRNKGGLTKQTKDLWAFLKLKRALCIYWMTYVSFKVELKPCLFWS